MPILIDGHNLIPQLGLSLRSIDDEMQLVERLQVFCRSSRQPVEVYFDGAPAGQARTRKHGLVTAHFVRKGATADSAISARLQALGRAARNWKVVSSDRRVQNEARALGAGVITSADFARQVASARMPEPDPGQKGLPEDEVEEWLNLFRENKR